MRHVQSVLVACVVMVVMMAELVEGVPLRRRKGSDESPRLLTGDVLTGHGGAHLTKDEGDLAREKVLRRKENVVNELAAGTDPDQQLKEMAVVMEEGNAPVNARLLYKIIYICSDPERPNRCRRHKLLNVLHRLFGDDLEPVTKGVQPVTKDLQPIKGAQSISKGDDSPAVGPIAVRTSREKRSQNDCERRRRRRGAVISFNRLLWGIFHGIKNPEPVVTKPPVPENDLGIYYVTGGHC